MTKNDKLKDAICELICVAEDAVDVERFEELDNAGADIIDCLDELEGYHAIGTVEEFKALKELNIPYKPQEYEDKYYACKCGNVVLIKYKKYPTELMPKKFGLDFCLSCGQKLDWSE